MICQFILTSFYLLVRSTDAIGEIFKIDRIKVTSISINFKGTNKKNVRSQRPSHKILQQHLIVVNLVSYHHYCWIIVPWFTVLVLIKD